MSRPLFHLAAAVLLATASGSLSAAADTPLLFERDIKPVLSRRCGSCHSERVQKGGLDLSTMAGLRLGGESGDPAVADSLDDSMLWIMIDSGDMPPEGRAPLTDAERQLLRRWIDSGAAAQTPAEQQPLNQHDVLPIVLLRCATCHGARLQRGGLDLRTPESMLRGGEHGPALVPGDPDASRMIQRIESQACPPRELLLKFFVRRPPASETQRLREWIAAGAPVEQVAPDVAGEQGDPLVTDEDRAHWAFQSPSTERLDATIDDFLLERLQQAGLDFSPEADRDTLIRRAHLDLLGMPPNVEQWRRWRGHDGADWYSQMIDELLASPRYGERWGRYWLDLAGYADSEGGVSADPVRPVAWKYRDYVIRSFNDDKPYDQFLLEQIAGDELLDVESAPTVTREMVDHLVATGFLRMGIDQTGSRTMNFVPERLGVIGDAITVLGEGLMGLTIGCARCHSHKYDPIPQRDYYRLKAVLQGAYDEHDWLTFKKRYLKIDVPERRRQVAEVNPPLLAKIRQLESRRKAAVAKVQTELLRQHYPQQPEADREETLRALRIADNNRTQTQRILVEMLQRVEILPDELQDDAVRAARQEVGEIDKQLLRTRRQLVPPLEIRALWDRGDPSPTYVLRRGEHDKPGRLVGPGVPSVLTDGRTPLVVDPPFPDGTPKTGRRLALAKWLTRPDHPLTARVMVNRIWQRHFGRGLVRTLENFGRQGEPPSHPELLDWLAVQFVRHDWSIKQMHRLMMNSRAYRQSSRVTDQQRQADPQNRLLSRMPLRRMDAEALRDSLLRVCGRLDETPGGPPDPVSVGRDGQVTAIPTAGGRWRRSVYLQYRRTEIPTMMDTFDYPEMGPNCLSRTVSTVSPQALLLLNNRRVRTLASGLAERVDAAVPHPPEEPPDCDAQVTAVYQIALSRMPNSQERRLGVEALRQFTSLWQGDADRALETYCHTILNSAAFLYVD